MFYNLNILFHVKLYIFYSCSKISKIILIILNYDPEKKNNRKQLWIAAQLFHVKHISVSSKKF